MKATCYLRIAKKRGYVRYGDSPFVFDASVKQPEEPLRQRGTALRTAVVKLNLGFGQELFGPAGELNVIVPAEAVKVLGGVES